MSPRTKQGPAVGLGQNTCRLTRTQTEADRRRRRVTATNQNRHFLINRSLGVRTDRITDEETSDKDGTVDRAMNNLGSGQTDDRTSVLVRQDHSGHNGKNRDERRGKDRKPVTRMTGEASRAEDARPGIMNPGAHRPDQDVIEDHSDRAGPAGESTSRDSVRQ